MTTAAAVTAPELFPSALTGKQDLRSRELRLAQRFAQTDAYWRAANTLPSA